MNTTIQANGKDRSRGAEAPSRPAVKPALSRSTATTGGSAPRMRRSALRREVANMTSQLAIMMRSGIDVASALESLARQCRKPHLKQILQQVREDVGAGKSLSQALGVHRAAFNETYVASVAAGEASGRLADVLNQLARLQRNEM